MRVNQLVDIVNQILLVGRAEAWHRHRPQLPAGRADLRHLRPADIANTLEGERQHRRAVTLSIIGNARPQVHRPGFQRVRRLRRSSRPARVNAVDG